MTPKTDLVLWECLSNVIYFFFPYGKEGDDIDLSESDYADVDDDDFFGTKQKSLVKRFTPSGVVKEEEEEEEEELSLSARAWGCWVSDSLWVGPPVSRAP
jgi:hypothetical protein